MKEKLLLHVCCAPCSSAVLERLHEEYEITILFYNPNITEINEYKKRVDELERFVKEAEFAHGIKVIKGDYNPQEFYDMSKGLEEEPERGKRCYKCYEQRLEYTAKYAQENGYKLFTTTLSISPHKNANWLNEIGERLAKRYEINHLYSDFKKKNGYARSIELSKEFNLYRQDYCGCIYSKMAAELRKNEKNNNEKNNAK